MLFEFLTRVALDYTREQMKPFAGSAFGNFVRHDVAIEARRHLTFLPFDLNVKASVGQSRWASVPWLAFFDPLVTDTATRGFYVVYLINPRDETITLSLMQGTTEVMNEFGQARGFDVLKRRARDIADRIPEYAAKFSEAPISLGSEAGLPAEYEAGHSFGKVYKAGSINEETASHDLLQMLLAYEALVNRGGITPSDLMQEEAGGKDIEETRRYILSRRIERSSGVRKAVFKLKKPICECCGLNPQIDYGFKGKPHESPLDVHHSIALHGLAEGETRRFKVPDDFMVLCPTCHRMLHKQANVSDLDGLKRRLRFKLLRELQYPMM